MLLRIASMERVLPRRIVRLARSSLVTTAKSINAIHPPSSLAPPGNVLSYASSGLLGFRAEQKNVKMGGSIQAFTSSSYLAGGHDGRPSADSDDRNTCIGSESPWSVFDAWGADELPKPELVDSLAKDLDLLSNDRLAVSTDPESPPNDEDVSMCLEAYDRVLASRSSVHFGYPYNLRYNHEELFPFMKYSINNLGDPFVTSNYGVHSRQFEKAVCDFFASLWKLPSREDYWGYVTTCGTEGNLHGILLAREVLPNGVLYSSRESHYSIFKAARYYRMDAHAIKTLATGEIDYNHLQKKIEENIDKPIIININIGTTVKGAVDNLDRVLRILKSMQIPRERFYIHCDGALFALMLPFVQYAPQINFDKPIDSIAVSGHKMLGCPMP